MVHILCLFWIGLTSCQRREDQRTCSTWRSVRRYGRDVFLFLRLGVFLRLKRIICLLFSKWNFVSFSRINHYDCSANVWTSSLEVFRFCKFWNHPKVEERFQQQVIDQLSGCKALFHLVFVRTEAWQPYKFYRRLVLFLIWTFFCSDIISNRRLLQRFRNLLHRLYGTSRNQSACSYLFCKHPC